MAVKRLVRSFVLGCMAFFLSVGAFSSEPQPFANMRLPEPVVETLENGLKVAWFLDDRLPLVDLGLVVESGSRRDPEGKSGTVELLSRLLERGSNGLSAIQMATRVERLGASGFSSSDEESVTIGMHGFAQDAPSLLETMAWMALRPNFAAEEFTREKRRIADAWKHLGDSVESLAGFAFGRAILSGTPYGRGSLQGLHELEKVSLEEVKSFHRQHFVPGNAILMVIGRVDRESLGKMIRSHFSSWSGESPRKRVARYRDPKLSIDLRKAIPSEAREVLIVDRPGSPQAQIRMGFRIPGISSPDRHALQVANSLLGEYFNSRLNLVVRDRLGLAYGIQSSLNYLKDAAFFSVGSATASVNAGRLIEETLKQLRSMKAADISEAEVVSSKEYLLGGYPLSVSTLGAVANRWLSGYLFGLGDDALNAFMPKIALVDRPSVLRAVTEAFDLDRMVIVVVGDARTIEKSMREKGFKKFRKISARSLL